MKAYGIDLGTTFSAISHITDYGVAEIICNQSQGDAKLMPSVVQYLGKNVSDGFIVGTPAAEEAVMVPDRTVEFAKRYIDNKVGEYEFPDGIPDGEGPIEVSAIVLGAIKEYANEAGHDVENVVITVPAYFGVRGREATKRAAGIAGLNVLHIISEPTAAAMYYCENERPDNQKILVYDLGGGTFDVVVVQTEVDADDKLIFKSLGVEGNKQLGGKDWDDILVDYIFTEAKEQLGEDVDYDSLDCDEKQKIRDTAVACKRAIGKAPFSKDAKIRIEGKNATVTVTKEKFEELSVDLFTQTMVTVDKVLSGCSLSENDIDLVLLVGGSTFMPMVQDAVKQKFGEDKVKVNNPNEAVALGAAVCAQKIQDIIEDYAQTEGGEVGSNTSDIGGSVQTETNASAEFGELGKTKKNVVEAAVEKLGGEIVSHSFGALVGGGCDEFDRHIDNLIYKGDPCPTECTKMYSSQGAGGLRVRFYENDCCGRLMKEFDDCVSEDEYYEANSEHFVFVTVDNETNEVLTSDKPDVKVDFAGVLVIDNPNIQEGDDIEVSISYWNQAIATVKHVATGEVYTYNLVHGSDEEHQRIVEQDQQRAEEAKKAKLYLA
jgi:molecular chaperone DnaK (HSP70)